MKNQGAISVLFVCMGNICRSPTAEGVFRAMLDRHGLAKQVEVDSAGTSDYHLGEPPDERARKAAARRGIDIAGLRGRRAEPEDIERFDYILAMDESNRHILLDFAPPGHEHKVRLFMEFARVHEMREVPDPYFGGSSGFERVLDMIEDASEGLVEDIRARLSESRAKGGA